MNWLGRFVASVATVFISSGSGSASTGPVSTQVDEAWATAVEKNSLEAYAAFIMIYPESQHAKSAYERLSGIPMPPKTQGGLLEPESAINDMSLFDFSSVAGKLRGWIV